MTRSWLVVGVVLFSGLASAADEGPEAIGGRKLKVPKGCKPKGADIACASAKVGWSAIDDTGFVFDAFEGAVKSVGAKVESSTEVACKVDKANAECKSFVVSGSTYSALPYVMIAMGKLKGKETKIVVQCASAKPFEPGVPAPCDQILSLAPVKK